MVETSLPGSLIPSVVAFFSSSRSCALGGGFFSRFLTIFLFGENVKFNRIPEVVLSLFESSFKPRSTTRLLRGDGSLNSCKNLSGRSYPSVKFEHFDEKMLTKLSLIRCRVSLAHLFLPWPEVSVTLLHPSLHHDDCFNLFQNLQLGQVDVGKQYELLRQLLHSSVVIGVDITI